MTGIVTSPSRRIAFGDDGSPGADVAWLWIVEHAWPGWALDVVTAHDPPIGPPPSQAERTLHEWAPASMRHAPPAAALAGVRHLTASIDPRLALLEPADLVVVGAQGAGVLHALHLGSTADWLLHDPTSPLVVARHGRATTRVLVCADGSAHAAAAIAAAATLPWLASTSVRVLVVDNGVIDAELAAGSTVAALRPTGAAIEVVRAQGRPTSAVLAEIATSSPDLVVLGTRGLGGWQRLRLGSTTNAVVRGTGCSVLVANADPD